MRGLEHYRDSKKEDTHQNSELKKSMIENGARWIIFKISRKSQSRDERKAIAGQTPKADTWAKVQIFCTVNYLKRDVRK